MIQIRRRFRFALRLVSLACLLTGLTAAQVPGVKRVYVDNFNVKDDPGKLRQDLIAQLKKMRSVDLVPTQSGADAFLSGSGEIWIKAYRSLNPRSGRLPSNGTPVYSGFLSVELKDAKGSTLWSYLVTPGVGSTNIETDLSRQVARQLAEALSPATSGKKAHK